MVKKELIMVTGEQRQRYLMNCAKIGVSVYGTGFEARLDIISMLLSIREDEFKNDFKKQFGDDIFNKIDEMMLAVSDMVSYRSGIDKRVLKKEDVTSARFLRYKGAISKCFDYLFLLDKMWFFLVKGTDLEDKTVPSHYWSYVSSEEISMPEEDKDDFVGED